MARQGRRHEELFTNMFTNFGNLLAEIPNWVKRGIGRRIEAGRIMIVSAVCPDYERVNGSFTYQAMGEGLPFTATQHLPIVKHLHEVLSRVGVEVIYHITLADTEFDLPLVVKHLANDSAELFLARCQESCRKLEVLAREMELPIATCGRFTDVFPDWFPTYHTALVAVEEQVRTDSGIKMDLARGAIHRIPLYQAMAGRGTQIPREYAEYMVKRQWVQYMAWGECAEKRFGSGIIMINHTTPNLSYVNHPVMRAGRERIPIIQLSITTMPGG